MRRTAPKPPGPPTEKAYRKRSRPPNARPEMPHPPGDESFLSLLQFPGPCPCVTDLSIRRSESIASASTLQRIVTETKPTRRYLVSGSVQGVGFRLFTQHAAQKLRVVGYVRNRFDGRVEVLATGTPDQLAGLRSILEKGPRFSSVSEVREEPAEPDPEYNNGFVIAPGE
jgi:acylphosphatase